MFAGKNHPGPGRPDISRAAAGRIFSFCEEVDKEKAKERKEKI